MNDVTTLDTMETRIQRLEDGMAALEKKVNGHEICCEIVELNVGGHVFQTTKSTLEQCDGSYLATLVSERHSVLRDAHQKIFIDRDPTHFATILNYLRDPTVPPRPLSAECFHEMQYYGLGVDVLGVVEIDKTCGPVVSILSQIGSHLVWSRSVAVPDNVDRIYACISLGTKTYIGTREAFFCYDGYSFTRLPAMKRSREILYSMIEYEGFLYVIGGDDQMERYDTATNAWDESFNKHRWGVSQNRPIIKRTNAACVVYHGEIYMIGGHSDLSNTSLDSIEVYNIETDTWRMFPQQLRTPREHPACSVYDDKVWVMGGNNIKGNTRYGLSSVEVFDTQTLEEGPELPERRSGAHTVVFQDQLYCVGGYGKEEKAYRNILVYDKRGWQPGPILRSNQYHRVVAFSM